MPVITVSLSPAIDATLRADHLRVGEHQNVRLVSQCAAGKAINVNRALTAMGIPTKATGFIGTGEADLFQRQILAVKAGGRCITTCRLISLDQVTRQNITILSAEGETHLRMEGFILNELEMRRLVGEVRAITSPGEMVAVAGSVPESLMAADAGPWLDFLRQIMEMGAALVVDTSGAALRACCGEALHVAKPNLMELGEIVRKEIAFDPPAIAEVAREALPRTRHRVISCGARGAMWVGDAQSLWGHYDGPVRVERTVGCGDFLLAGFVAGLYAGTDPAAALRRGITAATLRAMTPADAEVDLPLKKFKQVEAQVVEEPV